jgi:hypothetical protein
MIRNVYPGSGSETQESRYRTPHLVTTQKFLDFSTELTDDHKHWMIPIPLDQIVQQARSLESQALVGDL